jgi:hypothetical protein
MQNPRENKDAASQNFTIVHHKPTNSSLLKDGTVTTIDFLPGVMLRRVKPRMTKQ